jgi:branched-chain amino acid transport system permease protein
VLLQNVIFGLVQGSILALATVGFAMTRQTEGFLNIAHGQYLAIGAFLGLIFFDDFGMNVFVAGLMVTIALGAIGVAIARLVFDPVRKRGALVLLFTSIGLAYALYGAVLAIFGTEVKLFSVSFGESFALGSATITVGEIVIISLALLSVAGLWIFLTFTRLGTWVRAVASNPELARVRGVRVQLVSSTVWFLAAGLAGLAGMLLAIIGSASPELGWSNILVILAVAVMGGVGRIYAVIAAGLTLGLVMSLSAEVIPVAYQTVVAFSVLVLVLVVRPEGLFAVKRRREVAAS